MEPGTLIKKALLQVLDSPTSGGGGGKHLIPALHEKAGASWPGWVTVVT